ncbi:hypothetical protein BH24DEI1_BH24DEI1_11070 [soil metagenome]
MRASVLLPRRAAIRHLLLVFGLLLVGAASPYGVAQEPALDPSAGTAYGDGDPLGADPYGDDYLYGRDWGHAEGRIVAIDPRTRIATVRLANGELIRAELGELWSEDFGVNPYAQLPDFREGENVQLFFSLGPDGLRYNVEDWIRRPALLWLTLLFLVVSVAIGRGKGLRAFISTWASLAIAIFFVVPAILAGYSPVLVSLAGVGGMLVMAIYFVHGVSWSTSAALLGTLLTVIVTMALGVLFTDLAYLTGFGSDEARYIGLSGLEVNIRGLLLAGLLIGALGALTDITIVQASVVRELAHVNPAFGLRDLYGRAMNVGLDHIGSLVNTLVLAYTGAALPLLVLLTISEVGILRALNLEIVAAEVVTTLVGSIGLILAVPVTTLIAAFLFRGDRIPVAPGELEHTHHHH